jgi:hypothetical protein
LTVQRGRARMEDTTKLWKEAEERSAERENDRAAWQEGKHIVVEDFMNHGRAITCKECKYFKEKSMIPGGTYYLIVQCIKQNLYLTLSELRICQFKWWSPTVTNLPISSSPSSPLFSCSKWRRRSQHTLPYHITTILIGMVLLRQRRSVHFFQRVCAKFCAHPPLSR